MSVRCPHRHLLIALFVHLLAAGSVSADAPPTDAPPTDAPTWVARARELAQLRADIEAEQRELDSTRAELREQKHHWTRTLLELQSQVDAEKARESALQATIARRQATVESAAGANAALRTMVEAFATKLRAAIAESIPYERTARVQTVDQLLADLKLAVLPAHVAVGQLWTIAEDELRLSTDVGMSQQPIQLDGTTVLADVAHLGGVLACARTAAGAIACAGPGAEQYVEVADPRAIQSVTEWLDSLRGHVKQGPAQLPLPDLGTGP